MTEKKPPSSSFPIAMPSGTELESLDSDLVLLHYPIPQACLPSVLTEAEQDVALRVFSGATNQQIAAAREVTVKTVANQLESIYKKLGIVSRLELILELRRAPVWDK